MLLIFEKYFQTQIQNMFEKYFLSVINEKQRFNKIGTLMLKY